VLDKMVRALHPGGGYCSKRLTAFRWRHQVRNSSSR
jgi:hypothetical protein